MSNDVDRLGEGKNMGNSQGHEDTMNIKLYKWSSDEFREEYALIYTLSGLSFPARSCIFYYRVNPDKLALTVDDGLCDDNRVRLNMVFLAVRNEKNRFKFGPVKFKYCSSRYVDQRSRSREEEEEVLFLKYRDSSEIRMNMLDLKRKSEKLCEKRKSEKVYEFVFYTGVPEQRIYRHQMKVRCNGSEGIDVKLFGPMCHRVRGSAYIAFVGELCDVQIVSGMPPYDVIDNADHIRNQLKIEDGNRSSFGPPPNINIHNQGGNIIFNGNVHGDSNGCIVNETTKG